MIDHTGVGLMDYAASLLMAVPPEFTGGVTVVGYGRERPSFWLHEKGTASTPRTLPPAGATMAGPVCGRAIMQATTPPSCSILTATMSRRSVMPRNEGGRT